MSTHSKSFIHSESSLPGATSKTSLLPKVLVVACLVTLVGAGGVFLFLHRRNVKNEQASADCARAVRIYQAELLQQGETSSDPHVPQFVTEKERLDESLKVLDACQKEHQGTMIAPLMDIVRAGILVRASRSDEAQSMYERQERSSSTIIQALSMDARTILLERQSKLQEAEGLYQQAAQKGPSFYRPFFKLSQARLAFERKDTKAALELYKQVQDEGDLSVGYQTRIQNRLIEIE